MKTSLRKITALTGFQFQHIVKTPGLLMMLIISPILYAGLNFFYKMVGSAEHEVSAVYIAMALALELAMLPSLVASIIAEEKEKATLRVLMLSTVTAFEYVLGLIFAILSIEFIAFILFFLLLQVSLSLSAIFFLFVSALFSSIVACFIGAILGIYCENRSNVQTLSMLAMAFIIFGVLGVFFFPKYDVLFNLIFTAPFGRILKMLFIEPASYSVWELSKQLLISGIHLIIYPVLFHFLYKRNSWDK